MPMQMVVFVIGMLREGKRHSPWTKGLLHPKNHELRFRKKTQATTTAFKDTWDKVYREHHGEISREQWMGAMLKDDLLHEAVFTVDIKCPEKAEAQSIRDLAARKVDKIRSAKQLPDRQLSTCDWPKPCAFEKDCHAGREPSSSRFVVIQ
jgi:hypothetical protein